ncbi:MAG: SIS domain-containing protein, partial [Clostridiaceae bacterium]|nr:SIS domain-containing protein [Clostridiaceae bacterium]
KFSSGSEKEAVFVACGSSYWMSLSACMTFEQKTGIRSFAVSAGDILMNPDYYSKCFNKLLIIAPSRSGRTTEVLKAIEILKNAYGEIRVLSIVEYTGSPLENLSDSTITLHWANEESVCQTRSFSNLYLCMITMAALLGNDTKLFDDIEYYLNRAPGLFLTMEGKISSIVEGFKNCNYLVALGSGKQYGAAIEGAYIGIEMAVFPANYYSVLELRHGPIVRLDENSLVCIISNSNARNLEEGMAADAGKKGAKVLAIIDNGSFKNADWVFSMKNDSEPGVIAPEVVALYGIAIFQAFAYYKSIQLGLNPDNPPQLVPYINL